MYHALLTNRYLTTRVIPLIAVAAVALCVALVIIVVSVMTGFLDMVRSSGRKLMGDVVVSYPVTGIAGYERLIAELETRAEVAAATPVVDSWGLLKMPYPDGPDKQTETVQIWGIDADSFTEVTGYDETLYWRGLDDEQWDWLFRDVLRRDGPAWRDGLEPARQVALLDAAFPDSGLAETASDAAADLARWLEDVPDDVWAEVFYRLQFRPDAVRETAGDEAWQRLLAGDARLADREAIVEEGRRLRGGVTGEPGIVMGMHVSEGNERQHDGSYRPLRGGHWWMPRHEVTLTTIPVAEGSTLDPESFILPVLNEFVSGVFLIDDKRVMVPIDLAQRLLHLDEAELIDDNGDITGVDPARATMVLVRAAEGVDPDTLRGAVMETYLVFREGMQADPDAGRLPPPYPGFGLTIKTWEQQQAQFIGPIEKERELMRTLFSLVYLVCAGLVLSIFWAIVYEKTRDIGILRSVGASRIGITWIFLRYGVVIGVAGAIVGLGLAFLVVHNINTIHAALGDPPAWLAAVIGGAALLTVVITVVRGRGGRLLPIVLGALVAATLALIAVSIVLLRRSGGIVIWDPSVYYFTHIPNQVDMATAIGTMIGAVIFSLIGAFLPAAKAADVDPVRALRYE